MFMKIGWHVWKLATWWLKMFKEPSSVFSKRFDYQTDEEEEDTGQINLKKKIAHYFQEDCFC